MEFGRIIVYYPTRTIGGIQVLLAKISEKFISAGKPIVVLDKGNSYIKKYLTERGVKFTYQNILLEGEFKTNDNDVCILSIGHLLKIKEILRPSNGTRFIFWDFNPHSLIENLAFSKIYKSNSHKSIKVLLKKIENKYIDYLKETIQEGHLNSGIYFMCFRNFRSNDEFFSFNFSPKYLPVPITIKSGRRTYEQVIGQKTINIGWVSRLASNKVSILKLLIEDIIKFNKESTEYRVILHVIGDGDAKDNLLKFQNEFPQYIIMPGVFAENHLSDYLYKHEIDIGFSMGIASLEFASNGIATSLVPNTTLFNRVKRESKRYMWLFNSYGYDVAVENFHLGSGATIDFTEMIKEYIQDRSSVSLKSYNYVSANHNLNAVFEKTEQAIKQSNFTYEKIKQIELKNKITFIQKILLNMKKYYKANNIVK